MSRSALILAAHGSRQEPAVNQCVQVCATELARRGLFDVVAAAFNQGDPTYAVVLDRLEADEVTVVPFMAGAGYFSDVVLPRELGKNGRFSQVSLRVTAPVGAHPRIASIVEQRVRDLVRLHDLDPSATTLAVVGHGTERHERSRNTTARLADSLRELGVAGEVLFAFLDEEPRAEGVCERASKPSVIVVPFLIGAGPHAIRDIPSRLGLNLRGGTPPPACAHVGGRLVVCDTAVGTLPAIVDVIEALARDIP